MKKKLEQTLAPFVPPILLDRVVQRVLGHFEKSTRSPINKFGKSYVLLVKAAKEKDHEKFCKTLAELINEKDKRTLWRVLKVCMRHFAK
jgi:uncharacterized protein YrzB (UPF0473 family)